MKQEAGDSDTVYVGKENDFVYSARGTALVTAHGPDTFVYGVGLKQQTQDIICACVVDDSGTTGETNNDTI